MRKETECAPWKLRSGNTYFSMCVFEARRFVKLIETLPVSVAARSKAWVCGRSPAEIVCSNPAVGMLFLTVLSGLCFQAEVSATK